MRIVIAHGFFLPVPPAAGGAMEKMWWDLARAFAAAGHETTSVSRHWRGWPNDGVREGVRCLRLPGHGHTRHLALNLLFDARWGLRVLRRLPPADILVTNTVLLPALATRLRPAAGRVVVSLNRMPKGQLRAYGGVARVQAPSSAVAEAARRQAPRLADRIRIVPNTIDLARLRGGRDPADHAGDGPVRIGYIGRIHPEKGLALLVAAARRLADRADLPPWRLELLGPIDVERGGGGEDFAASLRARAPRLFDRGQIAFAPPEFNAAALARAYGRLDVFAYPSLAASGETFGVAVAEAMASGAACVVSDLPCFSDLVAPGHTGLAFAREGPDPAGALADALAALVLDPARRAAIAAAAAPVAARCDTAAVAAAMLEDFTALAAPR